MITKYSRNKKKKIETATQFKAHIVKKKNLENKSNEKERYVARLVKLYGRCFFVIFHWFLQTKKLHYNSKNVSWNFAKKKKKVKNTRKRAMPSQAIPMNYLYPCNVYISKFVENT